MTLMPLLRNDNTPGVFPSKAKLVTATALTTWFTRHRPNDLCKVLAFGRFGRGKSVAPLGVTCLKPCNKMGVGRQRHSHQYYPWPGFWRSPEVKLRVFSAPHRTNARSVPKLFRSIEASAWNKTRCLR